MYILDLKHSLMLQLVPNGLECELQCKECDVSFLIEMVLVQCMHIIVSRGGDWGSRDDFGRRDQSMPCILVSDASCFFALSCT